MKSPTKLLAYIPDESFEVIHLTCILDGTIEGQMIHRYGLAADGRVLLKFIHAGYVYHVDEFVWNPLKP